MALRKVQTLMHHGALVHIVSPRLVPELKELKACYAGFNVKFSTAVHLANELAEAVQFHRLSKLGKSLTKVDLLIIEVSYLTFNRHQSEMLFQVISERSERASIIIQPI